MSTLREELVQMLTAAIQQQQKAEIDFEQAKGQAYTVRGMVIALEQVIAVLNKHVDANP